MRLMKWGEIPKLKLTTSSGDFMYVEGECEEKDEKELTSEVLEEIKEKEEECFRWWKNCSIKKSEKG